MKIPFFRSPYNYDRDEVSKACVIVTDEPSLTVQSQAEDADINVMMKRFGVTGRMPENVRIPTYGDFTGVGDYQTALAAVMLAEDSFMTMPAETRARFMNDPQRFLDFCADPANVQDMVKMGLAVPKEGFNGDGTVKASQPSSQAGGSSTAGSRTQPGQGQPSGGSGSSKGTE